MVTSELTVEQIKAKKEALEKEMSRLANEFEKETGMEILSFYWWTAGERKVNVTAKL